MKRFLCIIIAIAFVLLICACKKDDAMIYASRYSNYSTGSYTAENAEYVFYFDIIEKAGVYYRPLQSDAEGILLFECDNPTAMTAGENYLAVAVESTENTDLLTYSVFVISVITKEISKLPQNFTAINDLFIDGDRLYCFYSDMYAHYLEKRFGNDFVSQYNLNNGAYQQLNSSFEKVGQFRTDSSESILSSVYRFVASDRLEIFLCIDDAVTKMHYSVRKEDRTILSSGGNNYIFDIDNGDCVMIGSKNYAKKDAEIVYCEDLLSGGTYSVVSTIQAPDKATEADWFTSSFGFIYQLEDGSYLMLVQAYSPSQIVHTHPGDNYLNSAHLYDCAYLINNKMEVSMVYVSNKAERIVYSANEYMIVFDGKEFQKVRYDGTATTIYALDNTINDCNIEGCGGSLYVYSENKLIDVVPLDKR